MTPAEVYREAAAILERSRLGDSPYACDSIGQACGWFAPHGAESDVQTEKRRREFCALRDRFVRLFSKEDGDMYGAFFGPPTPTNRNARILALCFMAAISDS